MARGKGFAKKDQEIKLSDLFNKGNFNEVVDICKKKKKIDDSDKEIQAASLLKLGMHEKCLEITTELLESRATSLVVSVHGSSLRHLGRFKEAIKVYEFYLQNNSDDPAVINNYANVLTDSEQPEKAQEILSKLMETNPFNITDVKASLSYAQSQLEARRITNQREDEKSVKKIKLSGINPLLDAFEAQEVEQKEKNQENSNSMTSLKVEDPEIQEAQGKVIANIAKEAELINGLIESDKVFAEELEILRNSRIGTEDAYREAASLIKRYGHLFPIYRTLADKCIENKNYQKAERILMISQIIQGDTVDVSVYLNLSSIALMRKEKGLAAIWMSRAHQIAPDHKLVKEAMKQLENAQGKEVYLEWS